MMILYSGLLFWAALYSQKSTHTPELDMDWIHPWIDWIGLGQDFQETLWIGLDWIL